MMMPDLISELEKAFAQAFPTHVDNTPPIADIKPIQVEEAKPAQVELSKQDQLAKAIDAYREHLVRYVGIPESVFCGYPRYEPDIKTYQGFRTCNQKPAEIENTQPCNDSWTSCWKNPKQQYISFGELVQSFIGKYTISTPSGVDKTTAQS